MLSSLGSIATSGLSGKLSSGSGPLKYITYTGTLVLGVNTTQFPNTTNYYYLYIQSGTGTITFNKTVTASVFAIGGGGGGGGNNSEQATPGSGGGGGGYYYTSSIPINSGQIISVTIGTGGNGGDGKSCITTGANGNNGGYTMISGGNFPSISLYSGGGGNGGRYDGNASIGGNFGTHNNGTAYGKIGGTTGNGGNVGDLITIGEMGAKNYGSGARSGNNRLATNLTDVAGQGPTIGGGGAGANGSNGSTYQAITGTKGGNGGMVIVLSKTV